ncbi:hypothetical protein BJV82DRAFT_39590 [Fennellomyces sp. T-0311]|nr:hypothetical protein BJV82DRAFT_39590 [Fennellomyces sp. T-0311]
MLNERRAHLEKQLLKQNDDQETRYRSAKRTRILDVIEASPSNLSLYSQSTRPRSVASVISEERNAFEPPETAEEAMSLQSPSLRLREGSVLSNVDSVFTLGESADDEGFAFAEPRNAKTPRKPLQWEPMDDDIRVQIDKVLKRTMDAVLDEMAEDGMGGREKIELRGHLLRYIKASKKRISRTPIPSYAKASLFDAAHLQSQVAQLEKRMNSMVNEMANIREHEILDEEALDHELRELSQLQDDYREKLAQEKKKKRELESLQSLINIPTAQDDYVIALLRYPSSKFSPSSTE